jgi:glycosyltransferase involved in cell wall biosynthesis
LDPDQAANRLAVDMSHAERFPHVSVVICTRNRPDRIGSTLQSVAAQEYPSYDVLVVDQSSGDETAALVAEARAHFPMIRYLRLETPGLSRAYNEGVRATTSRLLAFTDDDAVAPPDWLRHIEIAFAAHPQAGLLYGQVLLPPELVDRENSEGVTPGIPIPERTLLDRRHGFRVFGMGANFAARRQIFERVGGFDEVLGGGGPLQSSQDFDFMYRVFRSGETTLLEPSVVVYHYGFRSHSEWPATVRSYGIGVGGFCLKHLRMGDLYAFRLLAGFLTGASLRLLKRLVTFRTPSEQWAFLINVITGMRCSLRFPVDRSLRIYRVQP